MDKENALNDFAATLRLYDAAGNEIGWPSYDWRAEFWTTSAWCAYEASCIGGVMKNCINELGRIKVLFDNHKLLPGKVQVRFYAYLPDEEYPDGSERRIAPIRTEFEILPNDTALTPSAADIGVMLPYVKGDPFRYTDLTAEQMDELQRPATEAAIEANRAAVTANEAAGAANEAADKAAEATASMAEIEGAVVAAESSREEAEDDRQKAELERQKTFANIKDTIGDKADRTELSNVLAVDPMEPCEQPDIPEYQRLFIDMWVKAWGKYGGYDAEATDGRPFLGNDLRMTYDEAIKVFIYSLPLKSKEPNNYYHAYPDVRTFIPNMTSGMSMSYQGCYAYCSSLEVVRVLSGYGDAVNVSNLNTCFYLCRGLRAILGDIIFAGLPNVSGAFYRCEVLEEVRIKNLNQSISFEYSPRLSLESFAYMIAYASNTSDIPITVHPDVYAKLTGDTTTSAAAALSPEELAAWQQVFADAMDKQITFTTPE